jgi:hypothetical protein
MAASHHSSTRLWPFHLCLHRRSSSSLAAALGTRCGITTPSIDLRHAGCWTPVHSHRHRLLGRGAGGYLPIQGRQGAVFVMDDGDQPVSRGEHPLIYNLVMSTIDLSGNREEHYVQMPRCTPCQGKSDNKALRKCMPFGRPFEPSFSPSSWPAPLQHNPVSPARRLTCGPVA